jgi:hypothetical protein
MTTSVDEDYIEAGVLLIQFMERPGWGLMA